MKFMLIENFKNILLAELEHVPVFLVKKTSGYDTLTLLDSGIDLFPLEIKKIPTQKRICSQKISKNFPLSRPKILTRKTLLILLERTKEPNNAPS